MKATSTDNVARNRAIFISDVHLGTKDCQASQLNEFLKANHCQSLYIVGDFIDGWRMRKKVHWRKSYTRIIRRILKLSKRGVNIYYITGNHDEFLRKFANNRFDNIHLINKKVHTTADDKKLLVMHGDQFDGVTRAHTVLKWIGDWGYDLLMFLNRHFNRLRARYGYGYWSFAGFLKSHIKRAQTYINDFEDAASHYAQKQGFDGIICGHIHHASIKELNDISYYNTGDWVESCTALIEDMNGKFSIMDWKNHKLPQVTHEQEELIVEEIAPISVSAGNWS
ncbi:UDP-2,3-diacylglucosamine diphosphatase [Halioxenophilus sp. WMMB6]|uniref:UDP-2,3-diacylglucosamine diphosphatase n=1 Tax=Halioxenophilus sp. WMMB6 TaxID=3073815 RepID=UPI00295E9B72|nr:UDP-2,3-diacylglucosamine diphosphatase [Halioxenophilus sp. WMMB6]